MARCLLAIFAVTVAACGSSELEIRGDPQTGATATTAPPAPTTEAADQPDQTEQSGGDATSGPSRDDVEPSDAVAATIRDDRPGRPIDRRLFGTNLPAWVGPETMADETFRAAAVDSGATVVRMPGGSWSNSYDWLACEQGGDGCFWPWAARPADFAEFISATGQGPERRARY